MVVFILFFVNKVFIFFKIDMILVVFCIEIDLKLYFRNLVWVSFK